MISSIDLASQLSALTIFGLLGLYLLGRKNANPIRTALALACLANSAWALMLVLFPLRYTIPFPSDLAEFVRDYFWMAFLLKAMTTPDSPPPALLGSLRCLLWILLGTALVTLLYNQWSGANALNTMPKSDLVLHVALSIFGITLVEQYFRNTPAHARWGIKFLCLGLGTLFVYDFLLYAEGLLFSHVRGTLWITRGFINTLTAPLILISILRNREWAGQIHVSRHLVFHSVSLLGSGLYLLFMAAAGYYLRSVGGDWGPVLQFTFLAAATLLLLIVMFSGKIRSKFKVWINKHFFSYQYDYREEWMKFTRTLLSSDSPGKIYEAAITALGTLVECQKGALWMESEPGKPYECVAALGIGRALRPLAPDSSLIRFLSRSRWVIDLDEYRPGFPPYPDLVIPDWLSEIEDAWLIVPLMLYNQLIGFILLAQPLSKIEFNWEVSDLLKAAGHQLANSLAQQQASEALLVARQFESFHRMSAFIVHDLKNLIAQLSLLLENAEKHKNNPEFQEDVLFTIDNSVTKMNQLLLRLRGASTGQEQHSLDLHQRVRAALLSKSKFKPVPSLTVRQNARIRADPERLERVIGHIIQNACEATPYDGHVEILLDSTPTEAILEIRDSGKGMEEDFVKERLFRPFDSTKTSGMGIGAYECRTYVEELGGSVTVSSTVGKGTLFRLSFPLPLPPLSEVGIDASIRTG
ncbi:XrtA/PEP-CTERM system histidine kinase PrsK [Ferrovum sp.]|uniref:XrtA/PEP-CTERM system histidine kinase PrsK n=1 Tax=Ferrovum sp. TaxID=2609467 RepID=UPI0026105938|nr:XrtA/PEP-CTERM system histidine kinase PrsK [Ferrovum sp.]